MAPKPAVPDWLKPAAKPKANPVQAAVAKKPAATAPDWLTGTKPKTQDSGGGHGGLGGNLLGLAHTAAGVARAVPGLARDVGHDLVVAPAYEIKRGIQHPFGGGEVKHAPVLPAQQAQSFKRTGEDVIHPGRFVEAYNRGELFPKLLEDVANASVVASGASKVLTAGTRAGLGSAAAAEFSPRLAAARAAAEAPTAVAAREAAATTTGARLGGKLESVAKLGAQGAGLPAKPYELAIKGIKRAADIELPSGATIGGRAAATTLGSALKEGTQALANRRRVSEFVATNAGVPALQRAEDAYAAGQEATKGLTPDENRAVRLTLEERFQAPATRTALKALADQGTPEELQAFYAKINPAGLEDAAHTITPEAVDLAVQHAAGTLPPEVAVRMDRARDFLGGASKAFEEDFAVPGRGRTVPLNPEQLGDQALTHPTVRTAEARVAGATERAAAAREAVTSAEVGADVATLTGQAAKADRKLVKAQGKLTAAQEAVPSDWASRIEAAPARHRPALQTAAALDKTVGDLQTRLRESGDEGSAQALQKLRDDLPVTLDKLTAAGVDPIHVLGGYDPYARKGKGLVKAGGEGITKRRLSSERQRVVGLAPQTVQGSTARIVQETTQAIRNEAADKYLAERGVTAADLGLDPKLKGQALVDEMAARGKEAWDPRSITAAPQVKAIGAETRFLDRADKRAVAVYFKPDGAFERFMQQTFDKERRYWKDSVLPLSGQWHVGNIISNAVMDTIATGSLAWVAKVPDAYRAAKAEGHGVSGVPARIFGVTVDHDLISWAAQKTGESPNFIRRQLDRSYRANSFVDNVSRSAVFMAERDRLLAQGLPAEEAIAQAQRSSLRAAGDFTRMTKFEQQWMRRAMPFYTWARHVTQLVGHLAVEDPIRLVWTLHMADLYRDPGGGPFADSFAVGGGLLSVGNLSPLGQFQNLYLNPKGPLTGALQSLGPEFDLAAAAGAGVNLGRGAQPLRLPPGSGRLDEFGNPINTPLITRPRSLAQYALRQVPLAQTLTNLGYGQKLASYDTGEPMLRSGKLIDSTPRIPIVNQGGRLGILARQVGIPTITPFSSTASIQATTAKRQASAEKARLRYQAQLAKARKG